MIDNDDGDKNKKTTAVGDGGFLICELCDEIVEECYECGKLFEDGETIFCEDEGAVHYCEDCEDCEAYT